MRISETMDLGELKDRMGDATEQDARNMRDLLSETEYEDTADVPESEWVSLLNQAAQ